MFDIADRGRVCACIQEQHVLAAISGKISECSGCICRTDIPEILLVILEYTVAHRPAGSIPVGGSPHQVIGAVVVEIAGVEQLVAVEVAERAAPYVRSLLHQPGFGYG